VTSFRRSWLGAYSSKGLQLRPSTRGRVKRSQLEKIFVDRVRLLCGNTEMRRRGLCILFASLLIGVGQDAIATSVTFGFEGRLTQVGGPNGLALGDGFAGSFSYTLQQTGTNVPLIIPGEMTRYALGSFSVTVGGQRATSTGGRISIANDNLPFQNAPGVVWDGMELDPGPDAGGIVFGSINGFPVSDFLFSFWLILMGSPFRIRHCPETSP
jgi:hypothetical protein